MLAVARRGIVIVETSEVEVSYLIRITSSGSLKRVIGEVCLQELISSGLPGQLLL